MSETSLNDLLNRILHDFESLQKREDDIVHRSGSSIRLNVPVGTFPIESLIPYLFNNTLKYLKGTPGDKTHWSVPFKYKGTYCAITHEKFGIRYYTESCKPILLEEIIKPITKGIEALEKHLLRNLARKALETGEIVERNCFLILNKRYQYFLDLAKLRSTNISLRKYTSEHNILFDWLNKNPLSDFELGTLTYAMIDAYFSRLEHFLSIALMFTDFDPTTDSLINFLRKDWGNKFKCVFDISNNKEAKYFFDKLIRVKEDHRNIWAHGGFDKNYSSLYFHLPHLGNLPIQLTEINKSPIYYERYAETLTFNEIKRLFSKFDRWLFAKGSTFAWLYAHTGFEIPYTKKHLTKIRSFATSVDRFREYIYYENRYRSDLKNADI